jgi:hypothetical protein
MIDNVHGSDNPKKRRHNKIHTNNCKNGLIIFAQILKPLYLTIVQTQNTSWPYEPIHAHPYEAVKIKF